MSEISRLIQSFDKQRRRIEGRRKNTLQHRREDPWEAEEREKRYYRVAEEQVAQRDASEAIAYG